MYPTGPVHAPVQPVFLLLRFAKSPLFTGFKTTLKYWAIQRLLDRR